jgi:predicted dehydrogenase
MADRKITFAIIGAGSRGLDTFGECIRQNPEQGKVVAVAEPREVFRNKAVEQHNIRPENVFSDWRELLARPKLADAVIITTTDRFHVEPAIAAAEKKYDILLEKPMAPTPEECLKVFNAIQKNNVTFAVCHVLRHAPYYEKIKQIIDEGMLGEICTIQHMEGVCWWHQAHSYVRGNFSNEGRSSFMLLAKSCHDIDLLSWWVGKKCLNVSSFGHLKHFRAENQPAGAADRCMDCPLADGKCPYSAKKFYFERLHTDQHCWPLNVVIQEFTDEALERALREGPYGRCVYRCDNDVVDHQVVNLEYENNITASFTMTAFAPSGRKTRVMGSHGYLEGDENIIRVLNYATEKWTEYDVNKLATDLTGGHGGGDQQLIQAFINALRSGNPNYIRTGPEVTLETHLIVFAAEKSRREKRVVNMDEMYALNG